MAKPPAAKRQGGFVVSVNITCIGDLDQVAYTHKVSRKEVAAMSQNKGKKLIDFLKRNKEIQERLERVSTPTNISTGT